MLELGEGPAIYTHAEEWLTRSLGHDVCMAVELALHEEEEVV